MSIETRAQSAEFPIDLLAFSELMKPELTGLSVLTAVCGFYMASGASIDYVKLFYTALGTLLVGGAAGTLNQYLEKDLDLLMKRTERRPLPTGRLTPVTALAFGIILSFAGLFILRAGVNMLSYVLALVTLLSYLFVYTPMKRRSPFNTIIGAIPGALPTLIGWTAASNAISLPGATFFSILFAWQIPHFLSLAWMYRRDYGRAGFKMLPVIDEGGTRTADHILLYTIALVIASISLAFLSLAGNIYLAGVIVAGGVFVALAIRFWKASRLKEEETITILNSLSRKLFFASLAYLPAIMILMALDKI